MLLLLLLFDRLAYTHSKGVCRLPVLLLRVLLSVLLLSTVLPEVEQLAIAAVAAAVCAEAASLAVYKGCWELRG